MKQQFKDYFSYNKAERRGIFILLIIIFLLILVNFFLPLFRISENVYFSDFENDIITFENIQKQIKDSIDRSKRIDFTDINRSIAENKLNPFPFNPNNLPVEKWQALGLNEKQIKIIKNYETKGGKFYKKEDLKKIYGISENEYNILEPYIRIKTEKRFDKKKPNIAIAETLKPFEFNPNNLSIEKWREIGLPDKIIQTIKNYEKSGGKFYKKKDLKKIYGITENIYTALQSYIIIPEDTVRMAKFYADTSKQFVLEINSADTSDLVKLKGIGRYYAGRILKYRELLGGYYAKEQLLEVYGMDSTRYNGFINFVLVNPDSVIKININKASIKDLIKHPYIEFYIAKSLVIYREKNGKFNSLDEIIDVDLVYKELQSKLVPYFTLE